MIIPTGGPRPVFKVDRAKSYANALCFCSTPINPRGGTDIIPVTANIGSGNTGAANVSLNPNWINYRGNWILGHKMSTSISTSVSYFVPPILIKTSDGAYTGDYSVLILGNPGASEGDYRRLFMQGDRGQVQPSFLIIYNHDITVGVVAGKVSIYESPNGGGSLGSGYAVSNAGVADGATHCFTFRRKGGVYTIWRDGVNVTSGTSGNGSGNISGGGAGSDAICIGGLQNSNENNAANCTVALAAAWNRALSDIEMTMLGFDPLSMFISPVSQFPPLKFFLPSVSTSGAGHADGTASVSGIYAIGGVGHADGIANVSGVSPSHAGAGFADGIASVSGISVVNSGAGYADGVADVAGVAIVNRGAGHADGVASASGSSTTLTTRGGAALLMS